MGSEPAMLTSGEIFRNLRGPEEVGPPSGEQGQFALAPPEEFVRTFRSRWNAPIIPQAEVLIVRRSDALVAGRLSLGTVTSKTNKA